MTKDKGDFVDDEAPQEVAVLSAAEIADIKAKARKEILDAKKKAASTDLLEKEKQRLRNEEGLTTGNSHKDEMVEITIDLAPFADKLVINGQPFWHGRTYTVPRHQADSFREMMARGWEHNREIKGQSIKEGLANAHMAKLNAVKGGGKILDRNSV